jgi:hypothetical protein
LLIVVVVDDLNPEEMNRTAACCMEIPSPKEVNGSMPSIVWAVPATRTRENYILRFLKDARCSVRAVEVRLFKTGRLFDLVPEDRRRWEPRGDLTETAKEISKYIADSGSVDATIIASDEV